MKNHLITQVGMYRRPNLKLFPLIPVGTKTGFWTVIETGLFAVNSGRTTRACRCRCLCGTEKIMTTSRVRDNQSLSCGCRRRICNAKRSEIIPVGFQFGNWIVTETNLHKQMGSQTHRACRVLCACGTSRILTYGRLRNSNSCGCKKRLRSLDTVWNFVYRNTVRRGWEFSLSLKEFKVISKLPCTYCGVGPSNIQCGRYNDGGTMKIDAQMELCYSGIDRIDSSRGYVHGNVVPCCSVCNRMKSAMPLDDFLDAIARIQRHNPRAQDILGQAASLFNY
jgi:hypothetical protein